VTERQPPGLSWESWIERQIREGMERGEFDDLPGAGKPIADLHRPHDELWWVKEKLRREDVSYLPPTLALRKEVEDALDRVASAETEAAVREILTDINRRITRVNSQATLGPPSTVMPLDVEHVVQNWSAERGD